MKRSVLAVAAATAMAAMTLAACGSGNSTSSGGKGGAPGAVTISFMEAMSSGTQKSALATLTSRFEKANPKVKVNLIVEPAYATLEQKEQASVAAGDPPTMGEAYENWAASYANSQAIVPLTSYINGPNGVSSSVMSEFWGGIKKDLYLPDGKIYMWPFNKSDYEMFYNPTMLKKTGLAEPTTWAQFAAVAKKVTDGSTWATSIDPGTTTAPENGTYLYTSIVQAYGGGTMIVNGKPNFDSTAAVNAMKYMESLDSGGALKVGTNYPGQTCLGAARCAYDIETVAAYPYDVAAVGKKFKMAAAALPTGPAGAGNSLQGTNLVIFSHGSAAQKSAAWSFIKWLAEPQQTAYWAEQTGYLPVTQAALPLMKTYDRTHPYQAIASEELAHATGTPAYAWWTQAIGDLANALQSVLTHESTPAAALHQAQQQALSAEGSG